MNRVMRRRVARANAGAMVMWTAFLLVLLGALVGCATPPPPEPRVVTKEVQVPVVKACVPTDTPAPPAHYADEGLQAVADPVERLQRIGAANQQRKQRLAITEPVLAACR